jgi:hypothetical protein
LIISEQYAFFINPGWRPSFMLTYDQLLMAKDICYSRYQVFCARLWLYPETPLFDTTLSRHFAWQEECLARFGNEGYEVAKCTEELAKAYLSFTTDPLFGHGGPYLRFQAKVRDRERRLGGTAPFLVDAYHDILISCSSTAEIVELFGVQKMCGHPLIDPVRGGVSAAEEARAPDATLYSDACKIKNNFCRIYLAAYVQKHGTWPPLKFWGPTTRLQELHNMQARRLLTSSYPLEDWNTCRFVKHQEFEFHDNFLDLMDDKSISFYRSQKHASWKRGVRTTSHKRLLLDMIRREEISPRAVVDKVMTREIPIDWFIVSLYPKEREFKLAARMFSMLVFEIRLYFALTEANLADSIFPYLPQQTMTKDKVSVLRTFGDITRPLPPGPRVRFYLEVDLSRWNLRWRSLTVHLMGDVIDDIFGLRGVYTFVHEFFAQCLIMVRVADIEPPGIELETPPESPTLWYNHTGGFEGITQKLWSACTYSMVDLAMHGLALTYVLLGQGDNQVLAITAERAPRETAGALCKRLQPEIMRRLDDVCRRTNQILKPEECLESGSVVTYSKDVYVNGVDYHTSLKALGRLFPHAAADFPSVASDVGAVFAAALAAAERSRLPLVCYALGYLHAYHYLLRCLGGAGIYGRMLASVMIKKSLSLDTFIPYLLNLPSEMGGMAIAGFAAFLYKGGSDPLSRSLASVITLGRVSPPRSVYAVIHREAQQGAFLSSAPTMESLIMDPYGLPIAKPATPADRVAEATLQALRPHVRNKDLGEIMSTDCTDFAKALLEHLQRLRPLNPLIAHDLFDSSVAGLVKTLSRMLTSTRTIQTFVREGGSRIVETLVGQEGSSWRYWLRRWHERPRASADRAETIYATVTRLRASWARAGGEAPVGVTTYHPLDFPVVWGADALSPTGISMLMQGPEEGSPLFTRGDHDPYLGSMTREKRAEHGYRVVGRDTASADFRKLQLIASQVKGDQGVTALIDMIGHTRSDTPLSAISGLLTSVVGGSVEHRYASRLGHLSAYFLGSFAYASHCSISSDEAGFLSGGAVDYPVMVQEFFLTLIALSALRSALQPTPVDIGTICIGEAPLVPSGTTPLRLQGAMSLTPFRLRENALAYLPDIELQHNRSLFAMAAVSPAILRGTFAVSHDIALQATIAWFRDLLRTSNRSRLIADSAPGVTGRMWASLDLAETQSLGMARLISASAHAAAEEAVYHVWRTASRRRDRWRLSPFLWKLAVALGMVLAEHLGHPSMAQDATCKQYALAVPPRYAGGQHAVHTRIAGLISACARSLLRDTESTLYSQRHAVFASDKEMCASETAYKALCLALHRAWISGDMSAEDGTHLMRHFIIPLGRKKTDEESRVIEAQTVALGLSQWAHATGRATLAAACHAIGRGAKMIMYPVAVQEVLRDMRDRAKWKLSRLGARPDKEAARHAPRLLPLQVAYGHSASGHPGPRVLPSTHATRLLIAQAQTEASRGRLHGTWSSAHYGFLCAVRYCTRKDVLLVGAGHGAVARLCLEWGATSVTGLDLAISLPLAGHNFRWYQPPMVKEADEAPRYTQAEESLTTSGDWMDPVIARRVLLRMGLPSCPVIIDIQRASSRYGLEVLSPLITAQWAGHVFVRLFATVEELQFLLSDIQAGGGTADAYLAGPAMPAAITPFVLHIRTLPTVLVHTDICTAVVTTVPSFLLVPTPYMGGGTAFLQSQTTMNIHTVSSPVAMHTLFLHVRAAVRASQGEYISRPSFAEWTALLHAYAACIWLMAPSAVRTTILSDLCRGDSLRLPLFPGTLTVESSSILIRHITKVAARLA